MLKAYNDNNNDNNNTDNNKNNNNTDNNKNNNNKFRWEKLRWTNKNFTDMTDIDTDGQTKKDRQIHVHPSTYIVVHKHQRTL